MRQLVCRILNIVFITAALFYYQSMITMREGQIAQYNAQVQAAQDLALEYEKLTAQAAQEADEADYLEGILYGNGTFSGSGQGFGGLISLEITVEDHKITQLQILSADGEDAAYYQQAVKELPKAIIDAQSADVDIVSGATFSSEGIREAAAEALEKAKKARPTDKELLAERTNVNEKD